MTPLALLLKSSLAKGVSTAKSWMELQAQYQLVWKSSCTASITIQSSSQAPYPLVMMERIISRGSKCPKGEYSWLRWISKMWLTLLRRSLLRTNNLRSIYRSRFMNRPQTYRRSKLIGCIISSSQLTIRLFEWSNYLSSQIQAEKRWLRQTKMSQFWNFKSPQMLITSNFRMERLASGLLW